MLVACGDGEGEGGKFGIVSILYPKEKILLRIKVFLIMESKFLIKEIPSSSIYFLFF